jgi:hypothetical protein
MTAGKQTTKMTADELSALLSTPQTISITFTGEEFATLSMLAEGRGLPIEQYLKTLVREERDAAIEAAKAAGASASPR